MAVLFLMLVPIGWNFLVDHDSQWHVQTRCEQHDERFCKRRSEGDSGAAVDPLRLRPPGLYQDYVNARESRKEGSRTAARRTARSELTMRRLSYIS
jgi:hypothetical protein